MRKWRKGALAHCWGESKLVQRPWETVPYDPARPRLSLHRKETEDTNLKRYTHPSVRSSAIYNSHKLCGDISVHQCPTLKIRVSNAWSFLGSSSVPSSIYLPRCWQQTPRAEEHLNICQRAPSCPLLTTASVTHQLYTEVLDPCRNFQIKSFWGFYWN